MRELAILAFCAIAALFCLEAARWFQPESRQGEKKEAAQLMQCAMQVVRAEKLKIGIPIDRFADPNGTGMIGTAYNDITTIHGSGQAPNDILDLAEIVEGRIASTITCDC